MSLASTIARARAFQAAQFLSECSITRETTEGSFNPETDTWTDASTDDVYTGPCAFRPTERLGSDVQAGQAEVRMNNFELRLPVDTDLRKDDVVTMTASTYDAGLVGRVFRITDVLVHDLQIARVAMLEEDT